MASIAFMPATVHTPAKKAVVFVARSFRIAAGKNADDGAGRSTQAEGDRDSIKRPRLASMARASRKPAAQLRAKPQCQGVSMGVPVCSMRSEHATDPAAA